MIMTTAELITLMIAAAALLASAVSVVEMQRDRRNSARPVLMVLEKRPKGDRDAFDLYLVNVGNAAALSVRVFWEAGADVLDHVEPWLQTDVAAGRKITLSRDYPVSCAGTLRLVADYNDLDGHPYCTVYAREGEGLGGVPQRAFVGHRHRARGRLVGELEPIGNAILRAHHVPAAPRHDVAA